MERPKPTLDGVKIAHDALKVTIPKIDGVQVCAFFGNSPVISKAQEPDLDVLILMTEDTDKEKIDVVLQQTANISGIPVDAWVLSNSDELLSRMQRVTARYGPQPIPLESPENWHSPAYITVVGQEMLAQIIQQANAAPVYEVLIPPDASSKKYFKPQ